jgi:nitrous oxide reductase accessory protein NosL
MKLVLLLFVLTTQLLLASEPFTKHSTLKPVLTQKGDKKQWCAICGMKIEMFYKTSHSAKLPNGHDRQYCSMHCLVVDMKEYDIDLDTVKVVDVKTEKLIKAKDAYYVMYSKIKGTMSYVSKLAFEKRDDAQEFIKEYGGRIVSFDEALKQTKDSLSSDHKKLKSKKEKKIYPMGKKIYEAKCQKDIDLTKYLEINELKAAIKNENLCKPLKEKQLQVVSLYLWDVKRFGELEKITQRIKVDGSEKCPVCGMFVYKYPKWAAQIFYKHGEHSHHYSFDGVKDMMKFYFDPLKWGDYKNSKKENISKILVTDYYSQKAIDATKAFYVIGSDVYGPMGDELIPFEKLDEAKVFKADHVGVKILKFDEIKETEVYKLDQ